jgi:hypothetical protein
MDWRSLQHPVSSRFTADTPSQSRGTKCPSFARSLHPLIQEGAGKAGCRLAPTVRCAKAHAEKLHSGIQVKPNTRPSLRSGLTAYAVLSREPSSFWPPSLPRNSRTPRRLTRMPPPQELDRSNDGQDHTVLPYARSLVRHRARRRGAHSRRGIGETNYQRRSSARSLGLTESNPPCPHISCPTLPRPPQAQLAKNDDT